MTMLKLTATAAFAVAGLLSTLPVPAHAGPCNCTDTPPGEKFSCADQYRYGQCKERWMIENDFCAKTCGRCFCGANCSCTNLSPDTKYDCTQQKGFGKCDQAWMVKGHYCDASCGRCHNCPAAEHAAKAFPAVPDNSDPSFEIAGGSPSPSSDSASSDSDSPSDASAPESPDEETLPPPYATSVPHDDASSQEEPAEGKSELPSMEEHSPPPAEAQVPISTLESPSTATESPAGGMAADSTAGPKPDALSHAAGPHCQTVAHVLAGQPGLSTLLALATQAGLLPNLSKPNAAVTLFAPTNAAFAAFKTSLGADAELLLKDPSSLNAVIGYHVVDVPLKASQLTQGRKLHTMVSDDSGPLFLTVHLEGNKIIINGIASSATVTKANIPACGSFIHVVNNVLLPVSRPPST